MAEEKEDWDDMRYKKKGSRRGSMSKRGSALNVESENEVSKNNHRH